MSLVFQLHPTILPQLDQMVGLELVDTMVPRLTTLLRQHLPHQRSRVLLQRMGLQLHHLLPLILGGCRFGGGVEAQVQSVAALVVGARQSSVLLGWHGSFSHEWPDENRPSCLSDGAPIQHLHHRRHITTRGIDSHLLHSHTEILCQWNRKESTGCEAVICGLRG